MKNTLLTIMAAATCLTGWGSVQSTDFYSEDFIKMEGYSEYPTDGWLTYGTGAVPTEFATNYFKPDGSGPFYVLLSYEDMTIAMANTEFADGSQADQWLVTPEIEVPYDNAAMLFTACAFANKGQEMGVGLNTFKVMLSDSGDAKEDFQEELLSTSVRGSSSTYLTTKKLVVPVNGHKGEKVRLAFVVTGANVGLTGFTNIRMGQYIIDVTDYTPVVADLNSQVDVDINIGLKTPVECNYVDAVLAIDGENSVSTEYKKTFGSPTSNIMVMQRMLFENAIELNDDEPVQYSLTITPRFEGALPTVVTGNVSTPGATYPANVVIEEMTATGCGFCPRGIASLEYYKAEYPGSADQGKAIPIGIHGYMDYFDPMSEGVGEYLKYAQLLNGASRLPSAIFNRRTQGLDPSFTAEVSRQIAERSYNLATINEITVPAYTTIEEAHGKEVEVKFSVRNGYNAASRQLSAAVVLLENDVKGHNSGYIQANYYANYDEEWCTAQHGSAITKYLIPFLKDGELGYAKIPAHLMTYQHVARGIYPDFFGAQIASEWKSDVPQDFEISFEIPATVMDLSKTDIALLVMDDSTNAIVASDIFPASRYTTSGVDSVIDDADINVSAHNGVISVVAPDGSDVTVYAADGTLVAKGSMAGNTLDITVDHEGLLIVNVAGKSFKLLLD